MLIRYLRKNQRPILLLNYHLLLTERLLTFSFLLINHSKDVNIVERVDGGSLNYEYEEEHNEGAQDAEEYHQV